MNFHTKQYLIRRVEKGHLVVPPSMSRLPCGKVASRAHLILHLSGNLPNIQSAMGTWILILTKMMFHVLNQ